ncbi:unnamed protein product [Pseudo-nitzschia multistriata]|uniref:Uncharacterized protein n=1 Tax=Pseudo-nitzschia multistriata TaxID=183589 RepID=A0A448ZR98_9STRA|nr:unnamed protein product [Pseudo-nitzschia multistriata]
MLVQLSPWETASTSIRVPKRRRKRVGSKGSDKEGDQKEPPSFASHMITMVSKRSLSKMKMHSQEFAGCLPLLAITAGHQITVLGKNLSTETEGDSYREFTSLRYSSRPGDAGSFFAGPESDLPRIPAIPDTKNDRVYALQQGNQRLACWDSWKTGGPDEASAVKVRLENPAVSMSMLPMNKGIVYGSCKNGAVYVARMVGGALAVEYLRGKHSKNGKLVGTFAEIDMEQAVRGKKRKTSDADGNSSVRFYQVFCEGTTITIVRNSAMLSASGSHSNPDKPLIQTGSLVQNAAFVDLLGEAPANDRDNYELTRLELLVSSSGSAPKISVVFTVTATHSKTKTNGYSRRESAKDPFCGTFCMAISLATGDVSTSPLRLPPGSNQFGLFTESVLSAASDEMICLYDLETSAFLQSVSLEKPLSDMDKGGNWILGTNAKHGTLCVFYPRDGLLRVALSTVSGLGSSSERLRSSSKLACSLLANTTGALELMGNATDETQYKQGLLALTRLDEAVARALATLDEIRRTLVSQGDNAKSSNKPSFREAFYVALSNLTKDTEGSASTGGYPHYHCNGETPTKKMKNGKLNGAVHASLAAKGGKIPPCTPQSFIDGAVQIVLSTIIIGKEDRNGSNSSSFDELGLDARFVLKDLLRSGRVSARLHFEGLYALQETGKKHPLAIALGCMEYPAAGNPLSPLQIIIEMILNCTDLSERQLVVMLDYMMRHAKARDIVKIVREKHTHMVSKDLAALTNGDEKTTVLAGVRVVLEMIVGYSECNEAMLRAALVEELSSSVEAVLLARLLPGLLLSNPNRNSPRYFIRSTCLWIAALSESFRDDLGWARTSSGETYLAFLLNSVADTTKNSQEIMSLKDSIGVAEMIQKYKKVKAKKVSSEALQTEELVGYSIERIIF